MSGESAIVAEHVSKQFIINQGRAGDLREVFSSFWRKNNHKPLAGSAEPFYALRDVGFTINRGETVGIVGHNGSGKSTLLKMLTGILKPDAGSIRTRGRIGALIEVGAGFHPDLTGRENIFLNGSILGLSRHELAARFDDIVAFAGLEKFIDTPVKRYSSGMYMRLGFAIATHIEPEILLIDEVLAVGDTQFQNKCLNRLREFSQQGGTVVFVSHAMMQVAQLCERCLWLDRGQLLYDGRTENAIEQYLAVVAEREDEEFKRTRPAEWAAREEERRLEKEAAERTQQEIDAARAAEEEAQRLIEEERMNDPRRGRITYVRLLNRYGEAVNDIVSLEPFTVEIGYEFGRDMPQPVFCFEIYSTAQTLMYATNTFTHKMTAEMFGRKGILHLSAPSLPLNTGQYFIRLHLFPDGGEDGYFGLRSDWEERRLEALNFAVDAGKFGGDGCVYLPLEIEPVKAESETVVTAPPLPLVRKADVVGVETNAG